MATTTLNIKGMTCGACVRSVSSALQRQEGVDKVEVSLEASIAKVDYDPAMVTPEELAAAVDEIGFEARATGKS